MNNFATLLTEDIRLVILRALECDPGYSHNESILHSILNEFGHKVSRDRVKTELRWLEEQGLVSIHTVGNYMVAKLTGRGADVATGCTTVPGVKRPRPEA